MIKILIVEDQAMLRESLAKVINGQNDMEVVGQTDDAANAPELCRELKPDIVLMDVVTKNNTSGIHYTADIRREFPKIKVIIVTGIPDITFTDEAKKAGALSFIYKDSGNEHLMYVIRSAMRDIGIYPGPTKNMLFASQFSEKEIALIRLICQGEDRDEIAKKLDISEAMVKKHITSILNKTGFDSISKFAIYAVSNDLIVPDLHSTKG